MTTPAITVDGVKELRARLRRVKDSELDNEMKAIHQAISHEITQFALPRVPVRTGRLKASVRSSGTVREAVGRVGKKSVPYAAAVHWGWGPPFLTDAAKRLEHGITQRYDDAVSGMLDRTIGRG